MQNKYLIACLLMFILAACSEKQIKPVTILGKWQIDSYKQEIYKDETLISSIGANDFNSADFVIFNADGTGGGSSSKTVNAYFKSNFNFIYNKPTVTIIQYQNEGNTTITTPYIIDNINASSLEMHTLVNYVNNGVEYTKSEEIQLHRLQ